MDLFTVAKVSGGRRGEGGQEWRHRQWTQGQVGWADYEMCKILA